MAGRSPSSNIFKSAGPADTRRLASAFARAARGGECLVLTGPIGAGKTEFVKGLAAALGSKDSPVSASFNILRTYGGRLKVFHFDLFRLAPGELENTGFADYAGRADGIMAVEWGEDIKDTAYGAERLELEFRLAGGDSREIRAAAAGKEHSAALARMEKEWRRKKK
ncbi:MAG: tRNA (adenosine(37)-N6)-threonylcarbamoyltransferase complex ATPase subunit type 1 TsaE [Elusimicrobiales bacterium]|nr:tRNA (adenosine(37)-N6)-threonylcarbamoyltransferase complex ATPase subunit type 1 TsaE [Elusimicrobiales bacterium]